MVSNNTDLQTDTYNTVMLAYVTGIRNDNTMSTQFLLIVVTRPTRQFSGLLSFHTHLLQS